MTPLSGQPLAVPKWLLVRPIRLRQRVHLVGEGLLGPRDALGKHDRGVVARKRDDALEQVLDADLLARADRNMVEPACGPCHFCQVSGRTVHILLRRQLALVDQLEGDLGRHHLRHRCRRHADVGVLGVEHRARIEVDQIGDLGRRIELRRGGGRGAGEEDGSGGGEKDGARHEGW